MNARIVRRVGCVGLIIVLSLFMVQDATIAKDEVRMNEVKEIKTVQGRVNSIRLDKIIITYKPEDQEGTILQAYYLRDENTKFIHKDAEKIKPGDIVSITYEKTKWKNEKGRSRAEMTAKTVAFVRSKAAEELRKEAQEPAEVEGVGRNIFIDEEARQ